MLAFRRARYLLVQVGVDGWAGPGGGEDWDVEGWGEDCDVEDGSELLTGIDAALDELGAGLRVAVDNVGIVVGLGLHRWAATGEEKMLFSCLEQGMMM